ncbi:MAG TPA: hypothetical protein PL009_05585 [Flavipsychrobacter sp.]|nr:hypothetical protein [Flavipsychrobacter sp.]
MKYIISTFILSCLLSQNSFAQDDLFGTQKREAKKGLIISLNGNFDIPAGDMAKRFGLSYRVGPAVLYKTKANWMIGAKADFILGDKIKEEGLLNNIIDADKQLITRDGTTGAIQLYQRGYMLGLQAGKIINISKTNPDNGILLLTSAGFVQHKIHIVTRNAGDVPQLSSEYKKGYDRLANGVFLEQFVGYVHFSNNGLINFNIGLDVMAGFTQGRRDFWYDVQKAGTDKRLDVLFGLRGGWYIPVFKRKSEEIFFE